jgi:dipeptidyl aminopeptidase/acylaminoacyl peptidase
LRDASGQWQKVTEFDWFSPDTVVPRYIGPDGTVYVEASYGDKTAVYTLSADGKRNAEPVLASKDFDLHPQFIANDRKLLGLRFTVDAEVTQWLDADMAALQDQIDRLLPATGNRLQLPKHGDSPWVLVEAFADNQPTTTYAYERVAKRLVKLGNTHPGIDRSQLGRTDFVHIRARDGLDIPTYLTLPPGENKKNLPMVVLVHGGPWSRGTSWHFDPEVQFLASRGYAVLQAEFRGGTGFGSRHFKAGHRQWGRAMQDDLADATRWAIAQGHADAKRICIAGASYGGYATLMGLINDPELFRCGVEWVGVTDIGLMFSVDWSDVTEEWKKYGQVKLIGDPVTDAAALAAVSPLQNAARLKQPLLMAYGEFDARVPLIHGEKFRDAVKAHNPQVEWVVYEKEGHGWSRPETRIDFWGRVEKFLARHIGTPP